MNTSDSLPLGDDQLHAWVDGRLDPAQRAEVERRLAADPVLAARAEAWRRDAEALRSALAGWTALPPNPRLDPAAIRARLRARSRRSLSLAASFLLVLTLGTGAGWQMRAMRAPVVPMQDAMEAYRIYATDRLRPVEMNAGDPQKLEGWLSGRLGRPLAAPDLGSLGYQLLGGRLLPTPDGPAALLMYEDGKGQRVSFYVRPSQRFDGMSGHRADQGLSAQYWFRNGYGFAVVGREDDPHTPEVQEAIRAAI